MNRLASQRIFALIALAVCLAMVIDQWSPAPKFCGFRAGCDDVINSIYGRPAGIPISLVGLIAFGMFFLVSLGSPAVIARFVGPLALTAGFIGIGLVAIQVLVLKRICPLCLVVDALGILMAALELVWPASQAMAAPRRWVWLATAAVVLALPSIWASLQPEPKVPQAVRDMWQEGRINVIEITDLTCPYCRQTHQAIEKFRHMAGDKIYFERIIAPLKSHPESRAAAKLYLLAKQHGQSERAAELLFTAVDLSNAALHQYAGLLGFSAADLQLALNNPQYEATLNETLAWVERGAAGVPLICIDEQLLSGQQNEQSLEAAFRRAQQQREKLPPQ